MGVISAVVLFACKPVEKRQTLSNSFNKDDIKLTAENPGGSNLIKLKMNTKGVTGMWNYNFGTAYSDEATALVPYTGTHTFTYLATTPYMTTDGDPSKFEFISKTIQVEVTTMDAPINDAYYKLIGNDLEGKTWVFDGVPGDGKVWYAMTDPGNWEGVWWNAGSDCCPPADVDGKIVFDVDGGANYTYYSGPSAAPQKGSFVFNGDFTKISFPTIGLIGSFEGDKGGNTHNNYEIKVLDDNKMVLFTSDCFAGTGWVWHFKAI